MYITIYNCIQLAAHQPPSFCTDCLPPIQHVKSVLPVAILSVHKRLDGVNMSLVRYDFGFHDLHLQNNLPGGGTVDEEFNISVEHAERPASHQRLSFFNCSPFLEVGHFGGRANPILLQDICRWMQILLLSSFKAYKKQNPKP
jgi:hypothetical protein